MPVAVGRRPDTGAAGVAGAAGADASKSSALTVVVSPTLLEICLPDMPDTRNTRKTLDMPDTRDMAPAIPRPVRVSLAAMDMGKLRLAGRVRPTGVCRQPAQGCRGCR